MLTPEQSADIGWAADLLREYGYAITARSNHGWCRECGAPRIAGNIAHYPNHGCWRVARGWPRLDAPVVPPMRGVVRSTAPRGILSLEPGSAAHAARVAERALTDAERDGL